MNFWKTSKGVEAVSDLENYAADFCGNFEGKKTIDSRGKGGGHSNPKSFVAKAQHSFPKRGRGLQRPFGVFPKIHPFWGTEKFNYIAEIQIS